jgi:1-acyl-sn-glycerol-3-phosphate acyltransferase
MQAPDLMQSAPTHAAARPWRAPRTSEILRWALPSMHRLGDRLLLRTLALLASRQIVAIHGLEHIRPACDPFILVANHSTRREAILVPAMLFLHRGGRVVHFLADWNFRLIPGVGLIYARAQVVTVTRKSARPRFLNVLKPLYRHHRSSMERTKALLATGRSIGVFPEGTANRKTNELLRGRRGAARLSLETGVPVIPLGIRFPGIDPALPIPRKAPMELYIGAPLQPPSLDGAAVTMSDVGAWHSVIMTEIAQLSGKAWKGAAKEADP